MPALGAASLRSHCMLTANVYCAVPVYYIELCATQEHLDWDYRHRIDGFIDRR